MTLAFVGDPVEASVNDPESVQLHDVVLLS